MPTAIVPTREITLIEPLPGFADDLDFTLDAIDDGGALFSLRSVHRPQVRFILAAAEVFFPGFTPQLRGAVAEPLGGDEIELFFVLTVGTGLSDATANLRAPIVLAHRTNLAVQVILDDDSLSMRQPLVAA